MCSKAKIDEATYQKVKIHDQLPGMDFKGKVVLITGAARGLGRCFGEKLLGIGAKVCLTDVSKDVGNATAKELQAIHGCQNVIFTPCDVTSDTDFTNAWKECTESLGPVNILINNAGVSNEQNWELTYKVNIGGCTRGSLLAFNKMGLNNNGEGGAVVNIASIAGLKVIPFGPTYGASKHAIVGLSRDLGHPFHMKHTGVTVQCLCPGLVKTQFLEDSYKNVFSKEVEIAMKALAGIIIPMEPAVVCDALVKLLQEQRNGGVMAVEIDKEPYYVEAPVPST